VKHRVVDCSVVLFSTACHKGLAVSSSGRTPNILIFDLVLFAILGWSLDFELVLGLEAAALGRLDKRGTIRWVSVGQRLLCS